MSDQSTISEYNQGLKSVEWRISYKTSSTIIDGRPVDILHDFYLPALKQAVRYDRIAGYFRSSSLAAASQGFSAFVGREGKMRLIVGADMEPQDVKAILQGDAQCLAARLNGELDTPEVWPDGERNGVALLGWMIGQGYLEVKVAFRVHRQTGEPLSIDSVDDGYVHEKWFVMRDEFGHRLYGSGTLNESKTALVLNAENIDVHCDWWGEIEHQRVNDAEKDFEKLWSGQVTHMAVISLPEAVRRRLIHLANETRRPTEIDGTPARHGAVKPSAQELLRFAVLRDAPHLPKGRFVGLETAPVEPWPHQTMVARRLIKAWPYSYLLCDEVGLGKTIEAGLAFRSLYLTGLAKRILIAAPASLTRQWHREMASKVLMPFGLVRTGPEISHEYLLPQQETVMAATIYDPNLVILSTGLLARRERARGLQGSQTYDIALVDEAHAARRKNPGFNSTRSHPEFGYLYQMIREYVLPHSRSLWLATATPMQIDPIEVCDLLALTDRVGAFQFDPTLTLEYYEVLGKLVHQHDPSQDEWDFLRRSILSIQTQDSLLWKFITDNVIGRRQEVAARQWFENNRVPRGRDREQLVQLIFSASPLSRVMLRHTRGLLEVYREHGQLQQNLARRHVLPIPTVRFKPLEQRIYDQLQEYCEGLSKQIQAHATKQVRQMMSFLLSFLRLRFASSLYALRETLKRRLYKVEATLRHQWSQEQDDLNSGAISYADWLYEGEDEDDELAVKSLLKNRTVADLEWEQTRLQNMIAEMADLTGPSSKMEELLRRFEVRRDRATKRIKQTVVFTRFLDTLVDIVYRLHVADHLMRIGTYSGQTAEYFDVHLRRMISVSREEVKERFLRGEIDVLVCTDAAAEGLNLQSANLLVNFDLGWNPMKIEQRIGRIDRIGQRYSDVYVLNLCYLGSAEEIVYGRLLHRLTETNMIVGTQQLSLLPVTAEDFERLAAGTLSEDELMMIAQERIAAQQQRSERMEIPPKDLYEIYAQASRDKERWAAPITLDDIWEALSQSAYLHDQGCSFSADEAKPTMAVHGIRGIPEGSIMTVSREIYDLGLENSLGPIHFASYGDPLFDRLLSETAEFELPDCIRRITVPIPGLEIELVGYAVKCLAYSGLPETRLVLTYGDLKGLQIAENKSLTEAEIKPLRARLAKLARDEFDPYQAAERVKRENRRAAQAMEMLDFLVIRELLTEKALSAGQGALFWPVLHEVEALFDEKERIFVAGLPADELRPITSDFLFECTVPTLGHTANITVPRILGKAAIDSACRLAESMKVRRAELPVDTILGRLLKEAQIRKQMCKV
jgi:ERCC4-related helicase